MPSESVPPPSHPALMRQFWRALAGAAVTATGMLILGLLAGGIHNWLRWPAGALALILLVALNLKCSDAGEHLSKAKGIYHPMYGSFGPLGLLLAVFARRPRGA